ncbi:MAG: methylated-DNA--[protein]-cysteine S-methyltransferase, partial [Eggerthellaceae bacterium]|nr:methylated-DNA--[protein]-cysteine S-methyltransferase [Eggerthellaceae bacterium]
LPKEFMRSQSNTYYCYITPYGPLSISARGKNITRVVLGRSELDGKYAASETTNRAANEILQYLCGRRRGFDISVAPDGSDFQKRVWKALERIPYGQTRSAAFIAEVMGDKKSAPAVGAAVRRCPIAILIPSHRVIGPDGLPLGTPDEQKLKGACLNLESHFCKRR